MTVPDRQPEEGTSGNSKEDTVDMEPFYTISGFADEIDKDFDKQLAVVTRLGITHIELRGAYGKGVDSYTLEEAAKLKQKLDAAGVKVSAIGSPIGKIGIREDFEPHFEKFKHVVELAKFFEAPYIRMFSFYMKEDKPEAVRDEVLSRLRRLAAYAAQENVILLHENEKGIYGDNADRCLDLMKELYGKNFRCTFDFANFVQCKQETLAAYEALKPYIEYIHIKDAGMESGAVVPAGQGDGHVEEILGMLKESGFKGFLSLEPHLTAFEGLKNLEENPEKKGMTDGEAAFTLAHEALMAILNRLK